MSDKPLVIAGKTSHDAALALFQAVLDCESKTTNAALAKNSHGHELITRQEVLQTYAQCLSVAVGNRP